MNQTQALNRVKSGSNDNRYAVAEFGKLECGICHRIPKFCYEYWKGDITMEVCGICYNKLTRLEKLIDSIPAEVK